MTRRDEYDEYVDDLRALFIDAEIKTRELYASLYTSEETRLTRAMLQARLAQLEAIIEELDAGAVKWADNAITVATLDATAESLVSMGLVDTLEEAEKVAQLSAINKSYTFAQIATTQNDLLATSSYMKKQATSYISQSFSDELRAQIAIGRNNPKTLKSAVIKRIKAKKDIHIKDSAGRAWKTRDYVDMLAQTKMMEAHKGASINAGVEEGAKHGKISRHGATDDCKKWEGKIVKLVEDADGEYPFIDDLPNREIFHPRCRHVVTPIFLD